MNETELLVVSEDMTIYHAEAQKKQLIDALVGCESLTLDLSLVNEIDTSGLQLLMLAKREADALGKTLQIVGYSDAVRQILEFCNLFAYFAEPVADVERE